MQQDTRHVPSHGLFASFLLLSVSLTVLLVVCSPLRARHTAKLPVSSRVFNLQIVDNDVAREKGLSGWSSLAANSGMLFSYTNSDIRCFWMKDMQFSLDMIWVNAGKQVVHIQPDVSPGTYPQQFCPNQPAQYVIELNAGVAVAAGIRDGQTLRF
jgi:uncharacterized membrane protein (UPF0127 family)